MHLTVILRVTGTLLSLFSLALLLPAAVAWFYDEPILIDFLISFAITGVAGLAMWLPTRGQRELRAADGFLITVLFYVGLGLFGALPLFLSDVAGLSFSDAAFESLSGLTTTGATVIVGLDELPRALLFYRQFLQWLGGMGIVVLAVAILPMLGIGGMQLYRAESPGPVKDSKLTPRITGTAKALWTIYLMMTVSCGVAYWLAGMTPFDAICHAFSTVAIGGFSTHDASLGYFDSALIESIAIVFMILAAINFGLHFAAWSRRSPLLYLRDPEVRLFLLSLTAIGAIVITVLLQAEQDYDSPVRQAVFQTVSMATTTGFSTTDFASWPSVAPVLLLLAAFAGGCAGSTAGGIKMVRVLLIYLQGAREVRRLIHPNGIFPIKLGRNPVPDRVIDAVWSFFAAYVMIFLTMVCAVMALSDLDFLSAFSAVGACLNNLGPGLGDVAANYGEINVATQWILVLAMLLGRLEIFTLLVIFSPVFWRR